MKKGKKLTAVLLSLTMVMMFAVLAFAAGPYSMAIQNDNAEIGRAARWLP